MPETPRRRERGRRHGTQPALGHGPGPVPSPLPRQDVPPSPAHRTDLPTRAAELSALGPAFWDAVDAGIASIGLELSPGARAAIEAHVRLLVAWNAAINLTAVRELEQIAERHVLDSLAAVPLLHRLLVAPGRGRRAGGVSILDLGSGGGYPGVPVAICLPAADCALVDSVRKKARFLEVAGAAASDAMRAAGEAAPSFVSLPERAEDLADEPDHRERWRFVLARAVGSLGEVVELGIPLLAIGGHLVAWKRDAGDASLAAEVRDAHALVRATGAADLQIHPVVAAGPALHGHVLVTVRKVRPTPDRFPRPPAERRRAVC